MLNAKTQKELNLTLSAVVKKIKFQSSKASEANLLFAVGATAIEDLKFLNHKRVITMQGGDKKTLHSQEFISAVNYLNGDMIHMEMAGVDPEYVKRVLKEAGFGFIFN